MGQAPMDRSIPAWTWMGRQGRVRYCDSHSLFPIPVSK